MGTRSRIGVMHGSNCKSVYCHWDGYLEHNGKLLLEHYDSSKANHLVALGDLSSLDKNVEIPKVLNTVFRFRWTALLPSMAVIVAKLAVSFKLTTVLKSFLNVWTAVVQSGTTSCRTVCGM